ncbi:protease modulator HflC [Gammaproteobacteria bacterium]|nr:protease modulator HflC [Gammaproteobacteria bacterium]
MRINSSIILTVLIAVLLLLQCIFIVTPRDRSLLSYLGDLRQDAGVTLVYQPGLHFKKPILERVIRIDHRLQSFDVPSSRVLTADQKSVNVDYYVKWRVTNPAVFFKTTGASFAVAKNMIKSKTIDALRAEFGIRELSEIISGDERLQMVEMMQERASSSAKSLGVEVIDVRLKRVDYPQEVTLSVYERMRSSRDREAKKYRATGLAQSERIKSEADKDFVIIVADAKKQSAERVAEGEAKAASIYIDAYSKAPSFYEFYIKMMGYLDAVSPSDVFVLDPNQTEFFKNMAKVD